MTEATPAPPLATPGGSPAPNRRRKVLKAVVVLVLALIWIRFVLFAVLFPIVERRFDSPEISPDGAAEVASLGELGAWLDATVTSGG